LKTNIKKIIQSIKKTKESVEKLERKPMRLDIDYEKKYQQRDMRQEAMDMGAHGASEIWGGGDQQ